VLNLDGFNSIKDRINEARQRVSLINEKPITIVAVTKTFSHNAIIEAYEAGLIHIGENRVQEAINKFPKLPELPTLKKRLIGHLQTNKTRKAVNLFDVIDSVDSTKLANRINSVGQDQQKNVEVLLQVNSSNDPAKHGFRIEEKESLLKIIEMPYLTVKGLMTIGLFTENKTKIRKTFIELRLLKEKLNSELIEERRIHELSMGMSNDFEIAVEEGATMLRLGSALFGNRFNK
tara:strand:- start:12066 stop:12764 length:699 start_codon:yes stop_codon:yes gene_type:complete